MKGYEAVNRVVEEVCKAVIGKEEVVRQVMIALIADGHVLVDDIPGVGKTTMALAFSKAMNLEYNRVQFTPDVLPSDVTGFNILNRETNEFEYRQGAIWCNLFLADEINRTSSKTQSALLEAMEERQVTVDAVTYDLPDSFNVIATQNPVGSVGTNMLPDSQLDRFMFCVSMGYPSIEDEISMLKGKYQTRPLELVEQVIDERTFITIKQEVSEVFLNHKIYEYIVRIADASRKMQEISLGISPRGSVAIVKAAQAAAYMKGRTYVLPEDVKAVLYPCIRHRIILSGYARANGQSVKEIVERMINEQVRKD